MVERRPLAVIGGLLRELPTGDVVTGAMITPRAAFNVVDAARTGFITGDFVPSSRLSEADYATLLRSYAALAPDLVWVCFPANDYLTDVGGATPSVVSTQLSRLVDDLRALPSTPSVMLGVPHNLVGHENAGRTWAEYRAAVLGVVAAKGTGVFDIATVIPTQGTVSALLRSDGLHYSDAGHQAIADAMRTYLTGLLSSRPAWARAWIAAQTQDSAVMLAKGDSLTEGQGASTRALRWLDRLAVGYRAEHTLPAPTTTHTPPRYGVYGPDSTWTTAATATSGSIVNQDFTPALGRRTIELAAGATATYTLTGASAEIWVSSFGPCTYQVDDRAPLPLPAYFPGTFVPIQRVVIPLGFYEQHTVKLIAGTGTTYLAGLTASAAPGSAGGSPDGLSGIAALPAATTLDGTEIVPVVQGGITEKATVAQVGTYAAGLPPTRAQAVASALTTTPAAGYAVDTYVPKSSCVIPTGRLRAETMYRVKILVTKTAAGIVAPVVTVRMGTTGTLTDASRVALTLPAQTAAIDTALIEVFATFRTVGAGTTAVLHATCILDHTLAATGFSTANSAIVGLASAGFDSTVVNSIIGVSMNGGSAAAWTVSMVQAELFNLTP